MKATEDLRRQLPIHRTGSGFGYSGVPELAWLRGHHAGAYEAYLAVRKEHPEAAEIILKKFCLNPDGTIG